MTKDLHFALCEIDILRAMLVKQGINLFDSAHIENAISIIRTSLTAMGITASNTQAIVSQVQSSYTTIAPEQTPSLFPSQQGAQSSLALHHAARQGDLATVKKLVASGSRVDAKDVFSATPLHMAAMYGHKAVAEFLLNQGAQINAKTQKLTDFVLTPLDLAIQYAPNTEIVTYLIDKGAQPDHWDYVVFGLLQDAMDSADNKNFKAFDLALHKMEIISQNKNALWVYSESEVKPVLVLYKVLASEVTDAKFYDRVMKTINHLTVADKTFLEERYILAKNLLHAFPSDETYTYKIGPNTVKLNANGYYAIFAVEIAAQTLSAFQQAQDATADRIAYQSIKSQFPSNETILQSLDSYTHLKQQVFKSLEDIFKQGANTAIKASLFDTSETLFNHYESGKTIILPSGWDGHAIEIILNKELNLFIVANSGDRFEGFEAGVNAYNMHFSITPDVIYSILRNEDQLELEFKKFYDLDLEKNETYSLAMSDQIFGNCAWHSQQVAQQALLYIELSKITTNPELIASLMDTWFEEYSEFHLTYVLKAYVEDPFLNEAALSDILLTYHNDLNTQSARERAHLLIEVLSENAHSKGLDLTPEIKQYLIDNSHKMTDKLAASFDDVLSSTPIDITDVLCLNDSEVYQQSYAPPPLSLQSLLPVLAVHDEQIVNIL